MIKKQKKTLCIIVAIMFLLSGCSWTSGIGLFGEKQYSDEEADATWENVRGQIQDMDFAEYTYSIEIDVGYSEDYKFYWTEEYVVASVYSQGDYLWYEDYLYACVEEQMYYKEAAWDELGWQKILEESKDFLFQLLETEGTLSYKKVPMAGAGERLLTVKYPLMVMPSRELEVYPILRIWVNEEDQITSVILSWAEPGDEENLGSGDMGKIVFEPYEDSIDYQAERAIWFFAHDYGLIEEGVPSLNTQEDDRAYCEKNIESIDFAAAREKWQYEEGLRLPVWETDED